jgi:hypothetical protein
MPCGALQRVAARESERAQLATATTYALVHYDGYGVEMIEPSAAERTELGSLIARLAEGPPASARSCSS